MDRWTAAFSPSSFKGLIAPSWILMPNLPLQCWDEVNVCRIASMVGTPYLIDGNMFQWSRREFARVCVRVKLDEKLPLGVWVEGDLGKFYQNIEYERLSTFCFNFGKLSHLKEERLKKMLLISIKQNGEAPVSKEKLNCRGAKKKGFSLPQGGVKDHNVLFVGLLEAKMVSIKHKEVESFIGTGWDLSYVPSAGLSGGILMLWRSSLANFSMIESSSQFTIGDLDILNKGKWSIATIYGSKDVYNRRFLWDGLELPITNDLPMVIGGDFNCLLSKEDKKGGRIFSFSLGPKEMKSFMASNDLHELGFVGPRLTWSNNKKGADRIMDRLD
ncbi:uncharacterized protein LOC110110211 [Dendrobium catenatum]|uniref:uncharacterized protein LOC110110211 n=1 Tax=Dendrobium catenatum TaxID=906689 RepID=UPI0009F2A9E8|nr:uncharacterized protein LOC110110211 [Dendrobium catenatum]